MVPQSTIREPERKMTLTTGSKRRPDLLPDFLRMMKSSTNIKDQNFLDFFFFLKMTQRP